MVHIGYEYLLPGDQIMLLERGSTLVLRLAVLGVGAVVLALCVFVLAPALLREDELEWHILIASMLLSAVPFFIALLQTMKLLSLIDKNMAFSDLSVKALRS